jgi:cell wall-associated NlpC family hydrolase
LLAAAGILVSAAGSAQAGAPSRPILSGPGSVGVGSDLILTATASKGAAKCALVTVGSTGTRKRTALKGVSTKGSGIRASISKKARSGDWQLSLACGKKVSNALTVNVMADEPTKGGSLTSKVKVFKFDRNAPASLSQPNADQDAAGAPAAGLASIDGLGAVTGDRGTGAVEWAKAALGRTDYNFWCLAFVAHAYNSQVAGWKTAHEAANNLVLRDRGQSAKSAPAGALVFFRYQGNDGVDYGHVGISLGDGRMISGLKQVQIDDIDATPYWKSNYLGWAFAPTRWPGRPPSNMPTFSGDTPIATTPTGGKGPTIVTPGGTAPAPTTAPVATPAPAPVQAPAPTAPARRTITVDNRVTNGMGMREDPTPARLQTQPWIRCGSRGCNIGGTERTSGQTYDAAVCWLTGERTTNGHDTDASDDANPERFESTRYYRVALGNGVVGVISEVWIRAGDRGGAGLPQC